MMDRVRAFFAPAKASADEYEPLADDDSATLEGSVYEDSAPFSWIEYSIFALIGVAMLWAWYVPAQTLVGQYSNKPLGTCSSRPLPTSRFASSRTRGSTQTRSRPSSRHSPS